MAGLLQARGVAVFPSDRNISEFIYASSVVITTGLTSVNAEAALAGRLVINVVDLPPGVASREWRLECLEHLPTSGS